MRTQSVEVLNEADEMQRRMDFVIFSQETAIDYSTPGWVPGDPLWDRPEFGPVAGVQYVRPMIQLIDDLGRTWSYVRCEDCDVHWSGPDPCWMCGVERPSRRPSSELIYNIYHMHVDVSTNDRWRSAWEGIGFTPDRGFYSSSDALEVGIEV